MINVRDSSTKDVKVTTSAIAVMPTTIVPTFPLESVAEIV